MEENAEKCADWLIKERGLDLITPGRIDGSLVGQEKQIDDAIKEWAETEFGRPLNPLEFGPFKSLVLPLLRSV
jgi:hypothetical protein